MFTFLDRVSPAMLVLLLTAIATLLSIAGTFLIFWLHGQAVVRPSLIAAVVNPLVIAPPLASILVFVIYRLLRLEKEHAWMATHDGLTGFHNRAGFTAAADALLALARRDRKPLSLLMLDLDHFKAVNDAHGHLVGDQVLQQFSQRLRSLVRSSDLVCRFGGEEFLVLLNDADLNHACRFADKMREAISSRPFGANGGSRSLTVSIGVTSLASDGKAGSLDDLVKQADSALYTAKRLGRDQTRIYGDPRVQRANLTKK